MPRKPELHLPDGLDMQPKCSCIYLLISDMGTKFLQMVSESVAAAVGLAAGGFAVDSFHMQSHLFEAIPARQSQFQKSPQTRWVDLLMGDMGTQGLQTASDSAAAAAAGQAMGPVLGAHHVLRMRLQEVLLRCAIAYGAWPVALQAARSLTGTYQLLYPPVRTLSPSLCSHRTESLTSDQHCTSPAVAH